MRVKAEIESIRSEQASGVGVGGGRAGETTRGTLAGGWERQGPH